MTINGSNHIIDANHNSRFFLISASDVVLNDILFINGKSNSNGGAIRCDDGVTVNNCTFENNYATARGGGIFEANSNVYNCTFKNNVAG